MTETLLWLGAGVVSFIATAILAAQVARSAPLRRRNYRGIEVPTGGGIAPLSGFALGLGLVGFVHAVAPDAVNPAVGSVVGRVFLPAALGFGLIGLWDDVAAEEVRGWGAHVQSLRRGRPSSGAIKMAVGYALAFAIVAPTSRSFAWTLANAAIVALMANLFNYLDVRPGRASKSFIAAAVPLMFLGAPARPSLAAGLGGALAFLPFDLRERAMLGDAGANGLGAVVGLGVFATGSDAARLGVLGLLAVLTIIGSGPSISRLIAAVPPLRAADRWGRVPAVSEAEPPGGNEAPLL